MLFATLAAKKNVINSGGNRWPHVGDGVELVPPPCDPIATPQAFNLHAEETLYDASTQDQKNPYMMAMFLLAEVAMCKKLCTPNLILQRRMQM